MEIKVIASVFLIMLLSVSAIGVGLAYNSSVTVDSDITSSYCTISADVGGFPVSGVSITIDPENPTRYNLSFTSSSGTQETLSLNYHHTKGTNLILSISFTVSGLTTDSVLTIYCYDGTEVIGSTVLSNTGEKSGTISGILLGFEPDKVDGKAGYHFKIDGVKAIDSPIIKMSFSVYPMEVSS